MRLLPLLALSGTALAQQPGMLDKLQAWAFNFKDQILATLPNPIDAGASAVAANVVQPLNMNNWQTHLWPKETPEEWMVYITGGNKTCFGRCGHADKTWNESVALLSALPHKPSTPNLRLGSINCEQNEILCTSWSAGVPAIWHFIPSSTPGHTTDLRTIRFNSSRVTTEEMTSIPSKSESRYLKYEPYEGMMHPIDGTLQKFHLTTPFGYLIWLMGAVPSWVMMIVVSFASRQIMNRRMNDQMGTPAPRAPGAGGAAPAAQPAPAGRASPAGKGSSKKKR